MGINIPVVVVSGVGAPSSRQLTLYWICFIYKSAVGINIYILMVLEASGRCCESILDGWKSGGGCREAICALVKFNIDGFGISRKLL